MRYAACTELTGIFADAYQFVTDRVEPWRRAFRAACLVVGAVFLLLAIGFTIRAEMFLRNTIASNGIIVRNLLLYDKENNSTSYTPVFTFVAADGNNYTVSGDGGSNPPEFEVGQSVKVLYKLHNPSEAKIASFWQVWGLGFMFGVLGLVVTVTGYGLLLYERWLNRKGLSLRIRT